MIPEAMRSALAQAGDLEHAATVVLAWLKEEVGAALGAQSDPVRVGAGAHRVTGASIFLCGRTGLVGLRLKEDGRDPANLQSATQWRWIAEHRRPITNVVLTATFAVIRQDGTLVEMSPDPGYRDWTMQFHANCATHCVAWPLLSLQPDPVGFLSVEIHVPDAPADFHALPISLHDRILAVAAEMVPGLLEKPLGTLSRGNLPTWAGERTRPVLARLERCGEHDGNLLLVGPPGTGKTRLAEWVHQNSPRKRAKFLRVPMGNQSRDLVASQFFGHLKGAFTGAVQDHAGFLDEVAGGTLLLDDIDAASEEVQAALIGLLDTPVWRPIGGHVDRRADIRVIATTSRDLGTLVRTGHFRADLASRLRPGEVEVEPLDRRKDEIGAWSLLFLKEIVGDPQKFRPASIDQGAIDALRQRSWPDNLRGLYAALRDAYHTASWRLWRPEVKTVHILAEDIPPHKVQSGSLEELLVRAADQLLDVATARADGPAGAKLSDAAILEALVLVRGVQRWGVEEALRHLGHADTATGTNRWKFVNRRESSLTDIASRLGLDLDILRRLT